MQSSNFIRRFTGKLFQNFIFKNEIPQEMLIPIRPKLPFLTNYVWLGPLGRNFIFNNEIPEEIPFTFFKKLSLRAHNACFKL
jgi:hypothetical protein